MVPFGGWEMPVQYEGIIAEHQHTRESASLFDICHMGEIVLSGDRAREDLDHILTPNIAKLDQGRCRYGYMLNEKGGVLDDLICYRLDENRYMLVLNAATTAGDKEWIEAHVSSDTSLTDISDQTGKIDIQGPKSREILQEAIGQTVPDLKFFSTQEIEIDGVSVLVSRSGYTGEWGYELYLPVEETEAMWDRLLEHEQLKPAGLGARDTLRLEVGLPLYGNDLSEKRTPVAATHGMFIGKDKDFIGRPAVERDMQQGCDEYLVALQLEGRRAARAHDKVFLDGEHVGEVTSGSISPSLGTAIALAYLDDEAIERGREVEIETGRKMLKAVIVDLPFYKHGTVHGK